jgi:hypothetical protein
MPKATPYCEYPDHEGTDRYLPHQRDRVNVSIDLVSEDGNQRFRRFIVWKVCFACKAKMERKLDHRNYEDVPLF